MKIFVQILALTAIILASLSLGYHRQTIGVWVMLNRVGVDKGS